MTPQEILNWNSFDCLLSAQEKDELLKLVPGIDAQSLESVEQMFQFQGVLAQNLSELKDLILSGTLESHSTFKKMLKGAVPQPKKDGKIEPWKQQYVEEYWGQRAHLLPTPAPEPARISFRHDAKLNPDRVTSHATTWMEAEAAAAAAREATRKNGRRKPVGRPPNHAVKEEKVLGPAEEAGVLAVTEAVLDTSGVGRPLKALWVEVAKDARSHGFNQRSFSALLARQALNPDFPLYRRGNLWQLKRLCPPMAALEVRQLDEPPSLEPVYRDAVPSSFSLHVRRPPAARQQVLRS